MAKRAAVLMRAVRAKADTPAVSDGELLRRFASDGDQAAFAALTERHAGMVLGVCKRVLHSQADAEDACQAVFLILAKKAASNRWHSSVANWLYATARKVARNARVAATRRTKREGAAAVAEVVPPADTLTGPELLAALDEELDRLPPRYREPLVLCYLEGLTRDEAATRLGVPEATLKSQLERGRKKLADALTARGCALGVALLLTATSSAGASPPRLAESVMAAVNGAPSPAAAALAQGVAVNVVLSRVKLAIVAAVGAAALGFGVASVPVTAGPQTPAGKTVEPPATAANPVPPEQPGRKFAGAVYDTDNKPVRAELIFVPTGGDARVVGKCDAKGEFAITLPATPGVIGELLARADGYGVAGLTVWWKTPDELRFFVAPECVVRGRVIDQQGKPVAGATLSPLQFTAAAPERTDYFLKVWTRMHPQETAFNQMSGFEDTTFRIDPRLTLPDGRKLLTATTDADGRFALGGFGKEQVVELLVRGPGLADTHTLVVTRTGFDPDPVNRAAGDARKQYMLAPNGPIPSPVRLFGPTPTFVMEPEKPIRGTVTDDAGKPRAGVTVTFRRLSEKRHELLRPHTATTDKDGKFAIRGSRQYPTYLIETDATAGFKAARVTATDAAGLAPIEVQLRTPADAEREKERTIRGKVVGPDGKPVAADLTLRWTEGTVQPLGRANADGTFRVTVPLQKKGMGGALVATATGCGPDFHYHGYDYLPASVTLTAELAFRLPKERAIKGRVINQEGRPVSGATVSAYQFNAYDSDASLDAHLKTWAERATGNPLGGDRGMQYPKAARPPAATTDADGRFELGGFGIGQTVQLKLSGSGIADKGLVFVNRDGFDAAPVVAAAVRNAGKDRRFNPRWVPCGPGFTAVVEPEKLIRGRVTDHAGKPRAGARVRATRTTRTELTDHWYWHEATTDRDGKYVIRGVRKYPEYMVEVDGDQMTGQLPCHASATDTVGYEPVTLDATSERGVVVTGTLTDKATGRPIRGSVRAAVLEKNPFVKQYPTFLYPGSDGESRVWPDPDGAFRLVTIPGPVLLVANAADDSEFKPPVPDPDHPHDFTAAEGTLRFKKYRSSAEHLNGCWCKVLDAKAAGDELAVKIELEPATKTLVKVVDADGKPVTGTRAAGVEHKEYASATTFPDTDTLTVLNLDPKQERVVAVGHVGRNLVGTAMVSAATTDPVVKLGPACTVTGRAVDADGKPLTGLAVRLRYASRPVMEAAGGYYGRESATTDANGAFRIDGVFPDQGFGVSFFKGRKQIGPDGPTTHAVKKHGETLNLGDLKLKLGDEE